MLKFTLIFQALIVTFFLIHRFGTPLATEENVKTVVGVVDGFIKPKSYVYIILDGERYDVVGSDETIDPYPLRELHTYIHKGDTLTIRYIYTISTRYFFPMPEKTIVEMHAPSGTYRTMEGFNAYAPQRIQTVWIMAGVMEGLFLLSSSGIIYFEIMFCNTLKLTKSEKKKLKQFFKRR